MQYNSHSDSQDLVSLIGDATGLNTTSDIKQITRATNRAGKMIWSWIFEAYGGWQYDDDNNSDLPIAVATITADQQQYTLPSNAISVKGIEVKDEGGVWNTLEKTTLEEIRQHEAEIEFRKTSGKPEYYVPLGEIFKIYPASDYTQASSVRIIFDRGSTTFVSTDTTKTPGFVSEFHEAIADGASYFIARDKRLENLQLLKQGWAEWKVEIQDYYTKRYQENYPSKIIKSDYVRELI